MNKRNGKQNSKDLSHAFDLITKASTFMKEIETLSQDAEKIYPDYKSDIIDTIDAVNNIQMKIQTMVDGRPRPFSLLESYSYLVRGASNEDERTEAEQELGLWAEAGELSQRYPNESAAFIGSYSFGLDDLKEFRSWIDSVILWTEKKLSKPKEEKLVKEDGKVIPLSARKQ